MMHCWAVLLVTLVVLGAGTQAQNDGGSGSGSCSFNMLCVLDESGSIEHIDGENVWQKMQEFCRHVVREYHSRTQDSQYGVVEFNHAASLSIALNPDPQVVIDRIGDLTHGGGMTDIEVVLEAAKQHLEQTGGRSRRNVVYVVTDADMSTSDRLPAAEQLKAIADVVAIGIGQYVHEPGTQHLLNLLASAPGAGVPSVYSVENIDNIYQFIIIGDVIARGCGTGLAQQVLEDGCSYNVLCVLDESGSITHHGADTWNHMRDFCRHVVQEFDINTQDSRFGVAEFSDTASLSIRLQSDPEAVVDGIGALEYDGGMTDMQRVLNMALQEFQDDQGRRNVLFLITDADSQTADSVAAAERLKDVADVFAIGVGIYIHEHASQNLLSLVASEPVNDVPRLYSVPDVAQLQNAVPVRDIIRNSMCEDGGSQDIPGDCPYNILCVLDESGSIRHHGQDTWDHMKEFCAHVVRKYSTESNAAQFGVIEFNGAASLSVHLQSNSNSVINSIGNLEYDGGATDIANVLDSVLDELDSSSSELRKNIVFLVTDADATTAESLSRSNRLKAIADVFAIGVGIYVREDAPQDLLNMVASPMANGVSRVYTVDDPEDLINEVPIDDIIRRGTCEGMTQDVIDDVCSFNVLCLLDESGSIMHHGSSTWNNMKDFCVNTIVEFRTRTERSHYGVIEFSHTASMTISLQEDSTDVINRLRTLGFDGGQTDFSNAIDLAIEQLNDNSGRRNVVFFITDGDYTAPDNLQGLHDIADVFAVGVGGYIEEQLPREQLAMVASPSAHGVTRTYYVPDSSSINEQVQVERIITNSLCRT